MSRWVYRDVSMERMFGWTGGLQTGGKGASSGIGRYSRELRSLVDWGLQAGE